MIEEAESRRNTHRSKSLTEQPNRKEKSESHKSSRKRKRSVEDDEHLIIQKDVSSSRKPNESNNGDCVSRYLQRKRRKRSSSRVFAITNYDSTPNRRSRKEEDDINFIPYEVLIQIRERSSSLMEGRLVVPPSFSLPDQSDPIPWMTEGTTKRLKGDKGSSFCFFQDFECNMNVKQAIFREDSVGCVRKLFANLAIIFWSQGDLIHKGLLQLPLLPSFYCLIRYIFHYRKGSPEEDFLFTLMRNAIDSLQQELRRG